MTAVKTDVSVIIPTHNRRHTLATTLESVASQSHAAAEVIVIDDGSSDGTATWLRKAWPSVTLIEQANSGVSAARNRGIESATSTWIALLDSDDAWAPAKLARQFEALAAEPMHRLCHCDELWFRCGVRVNPKVRHRKSGGHIFEACLPLCAISPSAALIRADVFDDIGHFDESLPACEDYDFWLRFCAREPVLFVDEALVIKTGGHSDQLSRRYPAMDRYRIQALMTLLEHTPLGDTQRAAAVATLREKIAVYGAGARKRGRGDEIDALQSRFEALIGDSPPCS